MSGLVTFGPSLEPSENDTFIRLSGSTFHLLIEKALEALPSNNEEGVEMLTIAAMGTCLIFNDGHNPEDVRRQVTSALLEALPSVRKEVEAQPWPDREAQASNLDSLGEIGERLKALLR